MSEPAEEEDDRPFEPWDSEPPQPGGGREALLAAAVVTVATAILMRFAFDPDRAGTPTTLIALGALYAALAVVTVLRLRAHDELRATLRPASGDLAMGALVAAVLYGAARLVAQVGMAHGSAREPWLIRVYLQLGDPDADGRVLLGGAVLVTAAIEELVWRGLVMRSLHRAVGGARALVISSCLYALAHAPTLYLLRDPMAGLNPLVVAAALGCGFVWGGLYLRNGRLVPSLFAHAFFTWAVVELPMWRL